MGRTLNIWGLIVPITANLEGKRTIVTGAASGIGFATARLLGQMGATVAVNDLRLDARLESAIAKLRSEGIDAFPAPGDVGDAIDSRRMIRDAGLEMGGIDYLINNAATPGTTTPIPPSDLDQQTEEFWNKLLNVNLLGPFRCTHAAAPFLKASKGAVVSTLSTGASATGGSGSSSVYCVTKGGLLQLTRELAAGLAPDVRVNGIAPGMVSESEWPSRRTDEQRQKTARSFPLRRAGKPEEYAETILFLCAGASYITGQVIWVDGGGPTWWQDQEN